MRMFWVFFVLCAIFATGLAAAFLPQTENLRLALLAWQQLLFIIGGILGTSHRTFRRPDRRTLAWGFFSGIGLYAVNAVLGVASVEIALQFLDYDLVQNLVFQDRVGVETLLSSNKPLIFFGTALLLTVGAPLGEELFFRGLLVDLWSERLGSTKAILAAGLVFALLHFYVLQFVPVLVSGIILGILFVRSQNILVPILAHSVVNTLVLLIWLLSL